MHKYYITYNFSNNTCSYYLNEIYEFVPRCRRGTWNNFSNLKKSFLKTNMGQKTSFFIGPFIWNSLLDSVKKANTLNTFKDNAKKYYLNWIINNVYMSICLSVFTYVYILIRVCIFNYGYILVCFPLTYPFSCFFPCLPFFLIFFLTWQTTLKIRGFCPFCTISVIVDAIRICLH